MYLLHIRKYKKIIIIVPFIILFIIYLKILIDKPLKYTVIFNNDLSVSYPINFIISDIYSKNNAPYIQTSNNIYKDYINFKAPEEGFEFSYPNIFEINSSSFPGSEILYHISFKNRNDIMKNGFVQVWKLPYSLEEFLENSKKDAMVEFIDFKSKKISVNSINGYLWEYSFNSPSGKRKALEAFFVKNSKLYRISYFLPLSQYNIDEYNMFLNIVDSIKIK